ncbi:hypothetical protein H0H92_009772 [Tricholoma furcatifolium]|nr:hypothetical protein H0H92_009772 [Tricholoma furcatifolium]
MPSSALPLNVATPLKSDGDKDKTPTPSFKQPSAVKPSALAPADISSPHELTAFMSTRVDALEAAIQDIINGDGVPQSPSPTPATPAIRRSDSTQLQ